MAKTVIARVTGVVGKAYARNENGDLREIVAGDVLRQGEAVVTGEGGSVTLTLIDGSELAVSASSELSLGRDLLTGAAAGSDESALEDVSLEALLSALENGEDLGEVLEPPAAGGKDGAGGDGHSWVRLARIVETTDEFEGLGDASPVAGGRGQEGRDAMLPVDAVDDRASTEEGVPLVIDVQGNDTFVEGGRVTAVTQPAHGTVAINDDNTLSYTPEAGFVGEDTFTYTAVSADGNSGDSARVRVQVSAADDRTAPVDEPATLPEIMVGDASLAEGETVALTLTLSAPSERPVTVRFATADGSAMVSGGDYDAESGTLTFAPGQTTISIELTAHRDSLVEGTEDFLVQLSDPVNATIGDGQALVQITDLTELPSPPPAAAPPPAADDMPAVAAGSAVVDEAALPTGSDAGSAALSAAGTLEITTGVDQLARVLVDGQDLTAGGVATGEYGTLTVSVEGGVYHWSYTLGSPAAHPEAGRVGDAEGVAESFSLTVVDDDGDEASATLQIDLLDDGPTAYEDSVGASEGGPAVSGNVLANDGAGADGGLVVSGLEGGGLGAPLAGRYGSLTLQADGSYVYTPQASVPAGAEEVFTYAVTDSDGDSASSTLTLSFAGDNSAPTAVSGSAASSDASLASVSGSLAFAMGTDLPGSLSVTYDGGLGAATQRSEGGVTTLRAGDGSWELRLDEQSGDYTFAQLAAYAHDAGSDRAAAVVTVQLVDSDGSEATARLDLAIDDAGPVAAPDGPVSLAENESDIVIDVFANDVAGADSVDLVNGIVLSGGPSQGSVIYNQDGSFTYSPNVGAAGSDSFSYTITDSDGDASTATVSLEIEGDAVPRLSISNHAVVDEDDLPGGSGDTATGDAVSITSGTITYQLGNDSFASLVLSTANDTTALTTLAGDPVDTLWDGASNTLIGYVSGSDASVAVNRVFTVAVTPGTSTASYSVTLLQPVQHALAGTEDDVLFTVDIAVTDSDGSVGTTSLLVAIDDDMPLPFSPADTVVANGAESSGPKALNFKSAGADHNEQVDAAVVFGVTDGAAVRSASGDDVLLNGQPLTWQLAADGSVATAVSAGGTAFVITITGDSYAISDVSEGTFSLASDNVAFASGDGDISGGNGQYFGILALGDSVVDVVISTTEGATVNTTSEDVGVSNQWINAGQILAFDFYVDSAFSGNAGSDPGSFGSRKVNNFSFEISQGNPASFTVEATLDGEVVYSEVFTDVPVGDVVTVAADETYDHVVIKEVLGSTEGQNFSISPIGFTDYPPSDIALSVPVLGLDGDGDSVTSTIDLTIDQPDDPGSTAGSGQNQTAAYSLSAEPDGQQPADGGAGDHSGHLLATEGDDIFAFSLGAPDTTETIVIEGFGDSGEDVLDLRDLLQGEEHEDADLGAYLQVSSDGADTLIQVSTDGSFQGNAGDAARTDHSIMLEGVDLVSAHDDMQSVIQSMLDSGKLSVDV